MPPGKVYWQRRITTLNNKIDNQFQPDWDNIQIEGASASSYIEIAKIFDYIFNDMNKALDYHRKAIPHWKNQLSTFEVKNNHLWDTSCRFQLFQRRALNNYLIAIQHFRVNDLKNMKKHFQIATENEIKVLEFPKENYPYHGELFRVALNCVFIEEYSTAEEEFIKHMDKMKGLLERIRNVDEKMANNNNKDYSKEPIYNLIQYGLNKKPNLINKALARLDKVTKRLREKDLHFDTQEIHLYELCKMLERKI